MKSNYLLPVLLLFLSGKLNAQESGYFGKKTMIDFGAQGQLPIFLNTFHNEKGYVYKNGSLQKSYNLKDFSFRASIGTIVSENTAVAFEYSHHFYQVNPLRGGELNRQYIDSTGSLATQYIRPQVAFLEIQERVLMPKIVFSTNEGRIPGGLTHELGLGYCLISVKNRQPQTSFETSGTLTAAAISENMFDPEVEELKGFTAMYGLRMNFPITRNFLINVGVRYNYSWMLNKKGMRKTEQTEAWLSGRELWSRLNQRRQLGIITFGIGGTICL
jgi:hypothetical protein